MGAHSHTQGSPYLRIDQTKHPGTRKLLDFCAALPQSTTVMFTSSISVAGKWDTTVGSVPELSIADPEIASSSGYSSSKYVTEQVSLFMECYIQALSYSHGRCL